MLFDIVFFLGAPAGGATLSGRWGQC